MKNNKGFIAISLIYSFFLVFLMTLLTIVADFAHNRILLNDVKKTTQEKLNGLSEFNPISLKASTYTAGSSVTYASDTWKVLKDNGNSVTLILNRSLNQTEITTALTSIKNKNNGDFTSAQSGNKVRMCLNIYSSLVCSYIGTGVGQSVPYYWDDSVVKKILDEWLLDNALLQKAIQKGTLKSMTFSDGKKSYTNAFIRIPVRNEFNNANIWNLTSAGESSKQSLVYIYNTQVNTHNETKEIKPVIEVAETM